MPSSAGPVRFGVLLLTAASWIAQPAPPPNPASPTSSPITPVVILPLYSFAAAIAAGLPATASESPPPSTPASYTMPSRTYTGLPSRMVTATRPRLRGKYIELQPASASATRTTRVIDVEYHATCARRTADRGVV